MAYNLHVCAVAVSVSSGFKTLALSACSKTTMLSACKGKHLDPQGSDLRHILPLKLGYSGAEGGGERQEVLL